MATDYSITMTCNRCARTVTMTKATDVAQKEFKSYVCPECGNPLDWRVSGLTAQHSANVGAFVSLVQVIAHGSITSSTPT